MHTFAVVLLILTAVIMCVLMAVQTDKAEQGGGGVMGLGAAGGRSTGNIDMHVGPERILKPLTKWIGGAFVASAFLAAIPAKSVTFVHGLVVILLYVVLMKFGGAVWGTITGSNRAA